MEAAKGTPVAYDPVEQGPRGGETSARAVKRDQNQASCSGESRQSITAEKSKASSAHIFLCTIISYNLVGIQYRRSVSTRSSHSWLIYSAADTLTSDRYEVGLLNYLSCMKLISVESKIPENYRHATNSTHNILIEKETIQVERKGQRVEGPE